MVFLTVITGPCKAFGGYELLLFIEDQKHLKPFGKVCYLISFNVAGVCMIISGVVLVRSVKEIHSFFKDR